MSTLRELTLKHIERVRCFKWNTQAYMKFTYTRSPWPPHEINEGAWAKLYDPCGQMALKHLSNEPIMIPLPMEDYDEDAWEEYTGEQCEE